MKFTALALITSLLRACYPLPETAPTFPPVLGDPPTQSIHAPAR